VFFLLLLFKPPLHSPSNFFLPSSLDPSSTPSHSLSYSPLSKRKGLKQRPDLEQLLPSLPSTGITSRYVPPNLAKQFLSLKLP
jgi:hypothetical protein